MGDGGMAAKLGETNAWLGPGFGRGPGINPAGAPSVNGNHPRLPWSGRGPGGVRQGHNCRLSPNHEFGSLLPMQGAWNQGVTLVEVLELTRGFEAFSAAVEAATRRLEAEGIEELLTVQFYAQPGSTEAGAILVFADASRVMEHVRMITGWEEFKGLLAAVRPVDVRVYGKLSAEAEAWLQTMNVVSKTFAHPVAGFARWRPGGSAARGVNA
jgi:hypothetical protein